MRVKKTTDKKKPIPAPAVAKIAANPTKTWGLGKLPPACTKLGTIVINPNGIVKHNHPVQRGDCVQWQNKTGTARTLTFASWPFTEPWGPIEVPAYGYSLIYHVAQGVPSKMYYYTVNPGVAAGPPDPPAVVVGD